MCISLSRLTCQMQIMFCFHTMEVYVASTMYFSALDLVKISKLIEYQIIFQKKVLQNEKQIGWRYPAYIWIKAPSGTSKPTTTKRNKLQPQQPKHSTPPKHHRAKDLTNSNIKTTPSDHSLHLKVFSLLTKVPQLSLHFSYFVFQEPPQLSLHFPILSSKNLAS